MRRILYLSFVTLLLTPSLRAESINERDFKLARASAIQTGLQAICGSAAAPAAIAAATSLALMLHR